MDVLMDDTMYTLFWLCAIIALCFLLYFVRRQKKKEQGSKSEIAIHCEEWSCETQSVCSIAVEEEEYRINRLTASNGVIGTLPFPDVYVTLNNVVISMQVDSGASLTIISEHTFK
ncbi:Gag polyprotein [Trichinella spiralis]|uniref:Gag polyprotein n=1 Tax=Trichinella spiralis TaxID=6334 RepID=A0ABR3KXI7_TRISP